MRFKVYERARLPADDDMMIVRWCCDKEDENGNVVDAWLGDTATAGSTRILKNETRC